MYLFPAIDLLDQQVVRLLRGEYDQKTVYESNPLAQAQAFEDAGATWLHVVDLQGARSGVIEHLAVIEEICQKTNLKVEVGGGVRDQRVVRQLLDAGVERAILGTAALKQFDWFESLVHEPEMAQRLVLGLDARHGKLAIAGWEEEVEMTALEVAERVSDWPLAAIVYTDIATDGTLEGPNVEATAAIVEVTNVPVVASGGVGRLDDLRRLRELSIQGSIVGRALYDQAMTIDQALAVFEQGA